MNLRLKLYFVIKTWFVLDFGVVLRFWRLDLNLILRTKLNFGIEIRFLVKLDLDSSLWSKLDFVVKTRFWDQSLIWTRFWGQNSIWLSKSTWTRFWCRNSNLGSKLDLDLSLGSKIDFVFETRFCSQNSILRSKFG